MTLGQAGIRRIYPAVLPLPGAVVLGSKAFDQCGEGLVCDDPGPGGARSAFRFAPPW